MNRSSSPSSPAAIYARYSSHNQDDSTSIDVQLDACRRAAGGPCREYVDRAVTGTTMDRPAFRQMVADAEAGLFSTLFVYKFDRFGRSAHAHAVIADLEDIGVRVVSATEGCEPLSRGIQLVVAEDYSRRLSERVRDAKVRRFRERVWHGGVVPYGYRAENKRLVVEPEEARWVRWIFDRYLGDNIGFKQIGMELYEKGVRPRRSNAWTGGSVRNVLRHEIYNGEVWYHRNPDNAGRRRGQVRRPVTEHIRAEDESLRIIPALLFAQVQQKLAERPSFRPRGHNQIRRFSKLITCGECGATFIRRKSSTMKNASWSCGRRIKVDRRLCPNTTWIGEPRLVNFVNATFAEVFRERDAIIAEATAEAAELAAAGRRELDQVRRQIAALERDIDRTAGLLTDPNLAEAATKRALSRQIAHKTAQKEQLEQRRAELADAANDGLERLSAAVRQAFDEAQASLANVCTESEFNEFVRTFIGPMVADREGRIGPRERPEVQTAEAVGYRVLDRRL